MAFSFGAPSSAPAFGFGTPSQTPAAAPTSLFGAAAAPAPSSAPATGLFGAPAAVSSAASGNAFSFSFGGAAPPTSSAPAATTTSLFGAPALAPGAAPSLFGAPAAAGGGGLFGGGPVSTAPFSGTIAGQPAPGQTSVSTFASPDLSAVHELTAICEAFTPGTLRYRFRHLFFNVVEDPAARVRPPGVDELQWRAALQEMGGADNPDRLWPVVAEGTSGLLARRAAQEAALEEHASRLDALRAVLSSVAQRQRSLVEDGIEGLRMAHLSLAQRLLHVARNVDALEGRFAQTTGQMGASSATLGALRAQLAELEKALAGGSGALAFQLRDAAAAVSVRGPNPSVAGLLESRLDARSLAEVFELLKEQTSALAGIQAVLGRTERDLQIMRPESVSSAAA